MKKIINILAVTAAGFMLFAFAGKPANNTFEGIITFSMTIGGDVPPQQAAMMQGTTTKVYIKGDKSRIDISSAMFKRVIISDRKTKEMVTLSEMMGKKYEIKENKSKKITGDEKAPEIKYLDDTKNVAGYSCHHAQATITGKTGEKYTSDIFYTDQLPYSDDMGQFKGLKGMPLSYNIKQGAMSLTFAAQSILKQSVPDSLFAIPATGYKIVASQQEMMQDMQKNMQGGGGQ